MLISYYTSIHKALTLILEIYHLFKVKLKYIPEKI